MTTSTSNPFDLDEDEKKSMEEMLGQAADPATFTRGSLINATVIHSDKELVYLDIGKKQEGQCSRAEFNEVPEPGSEIPVVVLDSSADGAVQLSKRDADRRRALENIREAAQNNLQLSGKISRQVNHGYIVEVDGLDLFLPLSHSDIKPRKNRFQPGQNIDFRILELKDTSAVISRRVVLEELNEAGWNELAAKHSEGDEVEGVVSKIVSFGVFVTIGPIEGLVHQSDIGWKRFPKFKGRFKKGEKVQVKILGMDRENNRLSLGIKQLSEDPWVWAQRELQVGTTTRGRVASITDYGAFIEIRDGLEGLVHVSELSWAKRPGHPKNYVTMGAEQEAQVLALDFENKRISLGIKQLRPDPWENVRQEFQVGQVLEGPVTAITKFGAFVRLKEDVEGLVHFSDYSWDDKINRSLFKKNDTVQFKILEINLAERRISCGVKQLTPSPYEALRKKYRNGDVVECTIKSLTSFGLFAELEPGYEGLIHLSNIPLKEGEKLEERFKVGDKIQAALQKIDAENKKISLSITAFEKRQERAIIDQYVKKDDSPSTSSLGSFMKDALERTASSRTPEKK